MPCLRHFVFFMSPPINWWVAILCPCGTKKKNAKPDTDYRRLKLENTVLVNILWSYNILGSEHNY